MGDVIDFKIKEKADEARKSITKYINDDDCNPDEFI